MALALDSMFHARPLARAFGVLSVTPGDTPLVRAARRTLQVLLVVALVGLAGVLTALVGGHHVMGTTDEVPWGVLIATYVYFVASASGLCIVSSLGHVWGFERFAPLAKKATFLAVVMLVVGFSVIASELERPFRLLLYAVISPNPRSPIWWMGALYGVYLALLLTELYFLLVDDHRRARIAGTVSFFAAIAAQSNLGAVFGLSHARAALRLHHVDRAQVALVQIDHIAAQIVQGLRQVDRDARRIGHRETRRDARRRRFELDRQDHAVAGLRGGALLDDQASDWPGLVARHAPRRHAADGDFRHHHEQC